MSFGATKDGPCPLAIGNGIEHPDYGTGTVDRAPVPLFGPDMKPGLYGLGHTGWMIHVSWDKPDGAPQSIAYQLGEPGMPATMTPLGAGGKAS